MTRLFYCFLFFTLILSSSCSNPAAPTLRLGTNVWPGYEPLYLARHKGWLDDEKVHLVELSSSSQTIQAFRNELIDAAALTLDETLLLLQSDINIKIVLVLDISTGADKIIGDDELPSFENIKGKRIGVENNALGAYIISRALEIHNIARQDVTIVPLEIHEQEAAFKQHKVDAVATFDPVSNRLIKAGGQVIFDSAEIPGEIVDVLIVRENYLNQYQNNIQYLLNSWFKSLTYIKQHQQDAAKILGTRMKLDTKATIAAYDGLLLATPQHNVRLLQHEPPELLTTANRLYQLMKEKQLLNTNINTSKLFSRLPLKYENTK